eukprot:TRINITY_DN58036_c0_g1_i1.p1 TRINITY_DN58036_c0_g1~~TRINITY_DN58036_c0_g1_i1.p1  ORF type:complete len:168 (+),score=10.52 TRINITY_DN58036_c0_g1_i1:51-554(+)
MESLSHLRLVEILFTTMWTVTILNTAGESSIKQVVPHVMRRAVLKASEHDTFGVTSTTTTITFPPGRWIQAQKPHTCDATCLEQNMECDSSTQSLITSEIAIKAAMETIGKNCTGKIKMREYHGVPSIGFTDESTPRPFCIFLTPGAKSVCSSKGKYRGQFPLCYCF